MAEKWHELGPYTVFDFETTGMSPVRDRPVEIGAVRIETDGSMSRYTSLINPQMPITRRAVSVHGITDEMVSGAPPFEEVGAQFLEFAKDSKLVAHNARFDLAFLQESLHRCGLLIWNAGAYDSIAIVRKAFPGMPSYSLQSLRLSLSLGREISGDAHRAMFDAELTAELFGLAMNRLYQVYSN